MVDYEKIDADMLLLIEALNDWSGRDLSQGRDVKITFGCDDPCCATAFELNELIHRMRKSPALLYPVSGFSLSDQDDLRFDFHASSFRMTAHMSGSRADGVAIAETRHIRDVEAAMQLWVFFAVEDCMAYLYEQMDTHNLFLEEEERAAVRQIITSALQDRFSIGQIWNAMWRSVKDAAALSTRKYYNNTKAAKTIPKKIDRVLTCAISDPAFAPYDRITATPLGAVLTLFREKFGIEDSTMGAQVRTTLAADAALAPQLEKNEFDNGRGLVRGAFYFLRQFTELDRIVLSCFDGIELDAQEPEWDENHMLGKILYSLNEFYAFDGGAFGNKLLALLDVTTPSDQDVARHAALARKKRAESGAWADESGWMGALSEVLVEGGVALDDARKISGAILCPSDPEDVCRIVRCVPLPVGLCAVRMDYAHVYPDYIEKSDKLCVGEFAFSFPEEQLGSDGCDRDVVISVTTENFDRLATLISSSILSAISSKNYEKKSKLMALVAGKLLEEASLSSDNSEVAPEIQAGC
jgi:hypothetical protein